MPRMNCPKCDADISWSYEPDDWSVGVGAGWYCNTCDLAVDDDGRSELMEGDLPIPTAEECGYGSPRGTPISELSGQPGPKDDPNHPDHARYAEYCRIARSWGYD